MPAMRIVESCDLAHVLPHDVHYRTRRNTSGWLRKPLQWLGMDELHHLLLFVDGDLRCPDALDLDALDALMPGANVDALVVNGNLQAGNIFNAETDASCGLVVLGNLAAHNICVGGQQVYVQGDLDVSGLYWGIYNHGCLNVRGDIRIKAFLDDDYIHDDRRFRHGDRVHIEHAFYLSDQPGWQRGDAIKSLLQPAFLHPNPQQILSWSSWLDEASILQALRENRSILRE